MLVGRGPSKAMQLAELPGIKSGLAGYAGGNSVSEKDSEPTALSQFFDSISAANKIVQENSPNFTKDEAEMLRPAGSRTPMSLKQLKQMAAAIHHAGNMGGLARGGLPKKYEKATPDGHNPEFITGVTGFYADGRGTGQSDDIPALLHDGDYVMDAETVSALGDGSSKAGREVLENFRGQIPHHAKSGGQVVPAKIADGEYVFPASFVTALGGGDNKRGASILNGLREKLRAHKRAAPLNKIPPKAKSPLEYIKKSKG